MLDDNFYFFRLLKRNFIFGNVLITFNGLGHDNNNNFQSYLRNLRCWVNSLMLPLSLILLLWKLLNKYFLVLL